jgi:hypothetical protein
LSGGDAGELASRIVDLAAQPQAAAEMAEAGRAFVRDNHSAAAIEATIRQSVAAIPLNRK